jgi:hypothetical protein
MRRAGRHFYTQERIQANGNYYARPWRRMADLFCVATGQAHGNQSRRRNAGILHQTDFNERVFATPVLVGAQLVSANGNEALRI